MSKPKERSELEYLRGIVKEQKSEIRHLKRQLSRADKKVKGYEENSVDSSEFEESDLGIETMTDGCTHCGKGQMTSVDIGIRVLIACTVCDYKRSVKK